MTLPRKVPAALIATFIERGYWAGKTLFDFLCETEAKYPNETAIKFKDEVYTFADFRRISMHLASSLVKLGVEKGDIVSVQLANCPQFMFLQMALSMLGAIINPLHLVFRKRDAYSMLNFCESKFLVLQASFGERDYVEDYADIKQDVPSLRRIILVGIPKNGKAPFDYTLFDELTSSNRGEETFAPRSVADDIFYLNFTSGTEGDPKGFVHTFNTILSGVHQDRLNLSVKDSILSLSPMTHTFGHTATYYGVIFGAKVVLLDKFEPSAAIQLLSEEKVTFFQGTPAHVYGVLNHSSFPGANIKSVRTVIVGGALTPKDLLLRVRSSLGAEVLTGYGMGETIIHTRLQLDDPDWAKLNTLGRVCGGSEIRIFDAVLSADNRAIGEIGFRGPSLFIEYYKNPIRTDETRDDEGWFRTGDVGYVDEEGYLRLTGRKKDMINRGGTKIYPAEVENLLMSHPKIRDVAIVPIPDKLFGERACAFVILHPGEAALTLEALQAFLRDRSVTPYKWPERLEIVTEFPMTPTGKARKEDLRRRAEMLIQEEQA